VWTRTESVCQFRAKPKLLQLFRRCGSVNIARNAFCYLGGRRAIAGRRRRVEQQRFAWLWPRGTMTHVASAQNGLPAEGRSRTRAGRAESVEERWLAWGRSGFAVAVVLVLIALGSANIQMRARWHEVEDGVLWSERAEGVIATEIAAGSAAARAGVQRGDVLIAVNGSPVQSAADVIEYEHRGAPGTRLTYTLLRLGARQAVDVSLVPAPQGSPMYFVLAAVGLFTLFVGASVRLRRPRDQATLHFFWLCVAFFGAFTFSFNGPFDRLDWVFYWGDATAMALLPPLLLHFTLVFPERPDHEARSTAFVPLVYLPALALAAARIVVVARGSQGGLPGPVFSRAIDTLERVEHLYLTVCAVAALAILARAFQQITSRTA